MTKNHTNTQTIIIFCSNSDVVHPSPGSVPVRIKQDRTCLSGRAGEIRQTDRERASERETDRERLRERVCVCDS